MSKPRVGDSDRRWSLPRGRILLRALRKDPSQEYLLYVPTTSVSGARVLVTLHGISRNAMELATTFASHCETHGTLLVVPIFDPETHDDYQRLGRQGRGVRADLAMHRCLEEIAMLTDADISRTCLVGFSGGAQLAHRYIMAHPHRVRRAVIIAAGWYTYPDHRERFPYGIRHHRSLPDVIFNPEDFLRVPIEVVVGGMDIGTSNVRRTERVDKQQGTTRLERARNWVSAMSAAARAYGLKPRVSLHEVPDVDHSFAAFCERKELPKLVDRMLAGKRTASAANGRKAKRKKVNLRNSGMSHVPGA